MRKLKPWMTKGIVNSIRNRERLFKKCKSQPFNINLKNKFIKYRNLLTRLIKIIKNK